MKFSPVLFAAILIPLPAFAQDLIVSDAWVPTAPPTAMVHAAYMTLHNGGTAPRILTGISAVGYAISHLHGSNETDGITTMTMLHNIEIPSGGTLHMQPGKLHVMLMAPEAPMTEGEAIELTLSFANGKRQRVEAKVIPRDLTN